MRLDWRRSPWVRSTLLATVCALTGAGSAHAQSSDGFLFGRPEFSLTVRGGFSQSHAGSDLFQDLGRDLTFKKSSFTGGAIGFEFAGMLSERLAVTGDVNFLSSTKPSFYRDLVDNNDQDIEQSTRLQRVPLSLNAKLYLTPPGRSIGRFAWIPSTVAPWVGGGLGMMWYQLRQTGDFVDFNTNNVFSDEFVSDGWTPMAQAMAGVDVNLSPRLALTGDARYLFTKRAVLTGDFRPYEPLDLSGVALSLGLTVRLQ